ncbi:MAG: hypothetical protein IJX38_01195 [Clostridia bacterium]|nr:hypothetical protein [Clostridia bacterium]
MPLLNYTTKVDVYTTIGAIQGCLVRHGARKIMQDYDSLGKPQALCFVIDTKFGMRGIKLPANVEAVHKVLERQKVKCDREQAERVAWRILKDWVEAQMAILESEMVQMDEIFLPYMVANDGATAYELYQNNQLLLGETSYGN